MSLRTDAAPSADRELRVRMGVTLLFLVVLPFAFVYTVLLLANTVGIALLEWATERPYHGEFYVDPVVLTVVVLGGFVVQYRYGPTAVLESVDARRVTAEEYPDLHATVTRLAAQAGVPEPEVAVLEADLPNAFAVGTADDGTVVVSTGLLDSLEDRELEAVLAHELAHLGNRDASLITVAWLLPTITYYLAVVAFWVLYGFYRLLGAGAGGGSRDGRGLAVAAVVITVTTVLTMAVSAMFWIASVLLYRLLSRHREYAADRGAAAITGDPAALASALERIDGRMPEIPDEDLRRYDGGVEALYLAPLEARAFGSKELISTDIFPDSHPPTDERIDRLRELERGGV